jgi:hypothetical protein
MEAPLNMSTRIRFRRDTAANWTSNNPTLTTGELGYETDTGKFKIGNNTNAWTALPYSITAELSEGNLNDLKDVSITSAANGDFLRWNGTAWINDAVNLSTDTVGSFVESLVAGTGITLANNSGEGATPTVTVDTTVIAPLASPALTGNPTATTQAAGNNTTRIATTAFVTDAVSTGVAGVAIGSLNDVADVTITTATNGDLLKWNGSAWVNAAGYALLASPALTGTPTAPTASANTNSTQIATTAYVTTAISTIAPSTTVLDGGNAYTLQFYVMGAVNAGGI